MKTYKEFIDENFDDELDEIKVGSVAKKMRRGIRKVMTKGGGVKKVLQKTKKGFKAAFAGSKQIRRQSGAEIGKQKQAVRKRKASGWLTKMKSNISKIKRKITQRKRVSRGL
tara:strand:+ start:183 stop:518 length:336 start_codon:yes stop_codon:yes gene_type:complete